MFDAKPLGPSEVLELSDLNLAEVAREMVRWQPVYQIRESADLLCVAGGDPFPVGYNNSVMALGTEPATDPTAILTAADEFFDPMGRGFTLWIREHLDAELAAHAEAAGLKRLSNTPGMVLDAPIAEKSLPSGFRIERALDAASIEDFAGVAPQAYATMGLPAEISATYFQTPQRMLHPHVLAVVGYLDDQPAATALATLSHGIAGICWVGTLEAARGKGLGEACTRAAGNWAFELGAGLMCLQASIQGEPIYERMGYREVTRYTWFVRGPKES
jgi:GNAT superfamily N-acetyltransferase